MLLSRGGFTAAFLIQCLEGEVPLLSYQDWCEGLSGQRLALAKRVIDLPRTKPIHPSPRLIK